MAKETAETLDAQAEVIEVTEADSLPITKEDASLITEDQDDTNACIKLPTYDDMTDEKIMRSMREVFKGFTFDGTLDYAKEFATPEQLAVYAQATLDDIRESIEVGETVKITHASAGLARFWCLGVVVDQTLKEASYGHGACNTLAKKMNKSVPYVYQLRDVAKQLTIKDCFLLGLRGCTTTTLRKLAQIKDKDVCKQIMLAFIEDTKDTADVTRIERATRSFKAAINEACKRVDVLAQTTTNPDEVVEDLSELVGPAYGNTMKMLDDLDRKLKKLASEEYVCSVCDTFADFAIVKSTPNAHEYLNQMKTRLAEVQKSVKAVENYLSDIDREMESLSKVEVIE